MYIQNNKFSGYNSPAFKCHYDTEKLLRCMSGKHNRIAEQINIVVDINKLTKSQTQSLIRNKSKLGEYLEQTRFKILKDYPDLEKWIKMLEQSNDNNVPEIIKVVQELFGKSIDIKTRRGRSYFD